MLSKTVVCDENKRVKRDIIECHSCLQKFQIRNMIDHVGIKIMVDSI